MKWKASASYDGGAKVSPKQAWKALGIEPTDELRAVKRAYAAKLKAIDPDKDPKAFLALREALQVAQWQVEYGEQDYDEPYEENEGEYDEEESWDEGNPEDWTPVQYEREPIEDDPDPAVMAQRAIQRILWEGEGDLSPWEQAELKQNIETLLSDERMEQVGFASETEDWLSWVLVNGIPRSDAAVPLVVEHFGWEKKLGTVGLSGSVEQLAYRKQDLEAAERLQQPSHRWHIAWMKLQEPAPSRIPFLEKRKYRSDIAELLQSIRHHNPGLEWTLDRDHIALWDKAKTAQAPSEGGGGFSFRWWWIGAIILFNVMRLIGDVGSDPKPITPTQNPVNVTQVANEFAWRTEQSPRVATWMITNQADVRRIMDESPGQIGGLPTCSALDAIASMTAMEYDKCLEGQLRRENYREPSKIALPNVPSLGASLPEPKSRMIYSSPLWESEQVPRVRQWMKAHPGEVDNLLQPHIKHGGLPDCSKLAAAAGMSATELVHCKRSQSDRQSRPQVAEAPVRDRAAVQRPPEESLQDPCKRPELADQPICKKMDMPTPPATNFPPPTELPEMPQ